MQRLGATSATIALVLPLAGCSGGDNDTMAATDGDMSSAVTTDVPVDEVPSTTTAGPPTSSTTTAMDPSPVGVDTSTGVEVPTPVDDPVAALVALWRTYPLHGPDGMCTLYPYVEIAQVHAMLASGLAADRDVTLAIEPAEIAPLARAVTTDEFDDSLRQVCG